MSQGIHKAHSSRFAAAVAATALAAAAVLFTALPASAHDELLGSDPAADAALDAMPAQIDLTFSANVATDEGATEIAVTDAAGASLVADAPVVLDNVVSQPLTGEGEGEITVLWKVVSSDGHPISGEYSFTVTAAAPAPTSSPSASAEPSASASAAPSETSSPTESAAPVPAEDADAPVWPWVVGGIIVLALIGAIVYLGASRARREKALAQAKSDPSTER